MSAPLSDQALSGAPAWLANASPWMRRALAFGAGAAATLGHAPLQLTLVFVAAIVALVWLLDVAATGPKRVWSGFATGWLFGFGHFSTGLYWISAAFLVDADTWGPAWGIPAAIALAAGLAVFWGVGAAVAMLFWTADWRRVPTFAVALFGTEWLRGHLFGGFPWLLPGYVWTPGEPISQLAALVGIYGLTLLTLLAAAAPALVLDRARMAWRLGPLLAAALLLGMAWGWGAQRLARAPVDAPGAQPIVRVADSGLGQAEKWETRPDQEWRVLQRYLEVSGAPEESRAAVVIWPEGAIPTINFFMLDNPDFLDAIGRGMGDRVLIAGLNRYERRGEDVLFFNSAVVIDGVSGRARVSQTYDKHRLVPFSEVMPLEDFVMSLGIPSLQRLGGFFTPGAPPSRLVVPGAAPAVVLICYEAIFPGLVPRGRERPGWIVSVTNDAWFGAGTGPSQHFGIARYRAIEEGLPMARAASGGISAIVDAYGRSVASTEGRINHAEAQLPPALVETIFARWGNILLLVLLVIIASLRFVPRLTR